VYSSKTEAFRNTFEKKKEIMINLKRSLEVALANKSFSGILESYVALLKYSLKISILVRYEELKLPREELQYVK
jgi:hypothetical protein